MGVGLGGDGELGGVESGVESGEERLGRKKGEGS